MHVITTILLVVGIVSQLQAQIFPEVKKDPLGCLYGVVDSNGTWLIEPSFDEVKTFSIDPYEDWSAYFKNDTVFPGYRLVRKNGLEGVLDNDLKWVIRPEFQKVQVKLFFDSFSLTSPPSDSLYIMPYGLTNHVKSYEVPATHNTRCGRYYPTLSSLSELTVKDTLDNWMNFDVKSKSFSEPFLKADWLSNQTVFGITVFRRDDKWAFLMKAKR